MIEYKKFEEYMLKLKEIMDADKELDKALKRFSLDFGGFSNTVAIELILSLLMEITHDVYKDIEYFIYELEWGTKWHKGCIISQDGKDIPMKTIEDLYNLLKENYNGKN